MKYAVFFKWRDLYEEEKNEVKIFQSKKKAEKFERKIRNETKGLINKYGLNGLYHPFYDICLVEVY